MKARALAALLLQHPDAEVYMQCGEGNENAAAVELPLRRGVTDGVQSPVRIVVLVPDESNTVFLPEIMLMDLG